MIFLTGLHYSYMELELISKSVVSMSKNYYIIPIWNWSKNSSTIESTLELELFREKCRSPNNSNFINYTSYEVSPPIFLSLSCVTSAGVSW